MSKDGRTLPNPLTDEQRKVMYELSRYAKAEDLLEGWQRKFLYQAGRFDGWFLNRFASYSDILKELLPDLPEELAAKTSEVIDAIDSADSGDEGGPSGYELEVNQLKHKAAHGAATPPERLQLAELLERVGALEEARAVAGELLEEFPGNQTVIKLSNRIGVTTGKTRPPLALKSRQAKKPAKSTKLTKVGKKAKSSKKAMKRRT